MKIAFLSDIHGNALALRAVLDDIRAHGVDRIVVNGDICYRGPQPKQALEMVRKLDATVIRGNADVWTVRGIRKGEVPEKALAMMNREWEWVSERLDGQDLKYLEQLPLDTSFRVGETDIHCFHATPDNEFAIVRPGDGDEQLIERLMGRQAQIVIYSHIHLPFIRYINGRTLINTGSVGLPFDGLRHAAYVLVEAGAQRYRATIERVPYDVDAAIAQYEAGRYPNTKTMAAVLRYARPPS